MTIISAGSALAIQAAAARLDDDIHDNDDASKGLVKPSSSATDPEAQRIFRRLHANILPIFVLMATCCYLDRTNLAFASLQLNKDLHFTADVYGLGSGLFFVGYAFFMIPSQLLLMRIGAPRWLAIQVSVWGMIASSFSFMTTKRHFYVLRMLLGIAEAGAFPGMWSYLNSVYPADAITVPYSVIEAAVGLANVTAAPLAAMLLLLDGVRGMRGWQWLFVLEGVPCVLIGLSIAYVLPMDYQSASFLTGSDKSWLAQALAQNKKHERDAEGATSWQLLAEAAHNGRLWYVTTAGLLKNVAVTGILFWCPILVNTIVYGGSVDVTAPQTSSTPAAHHSTDTQAVALTAIPFICGAGTAIWLGGMSQRLGEKCRLIAIPYWCCALLLLSFPAVAAQSPILGFTWLVLIIGTVNAPNAVLNSLASTVGQGPAQAVSLACYNSLANTGSFVGPFLIGAVVKHTGAYAAAMQVLGVLMAISGCMLWHMRRCRL